MAEEKKEEHKRKHLKRVVTEETHDGKFLHHHTYTKSRDDEHEEPERRNVAVSNTPEEAGQHVAEQMGMNEPPDQGADPGAPQPTPDPSAGGGAAPAPAGAGM
jgi:hypothetical protein